MVDVRVGRDDRLAVPLLLGLLDLDPLVLLLVVFLVRINEGVQRLDLLVVDLLSLREDFALVILDQLPHVLGLLVPVALDLVHVEAAGVLLHVPVHELSKKI